MSTPPFALEADSGLTVRDYTAGPVLGPSGARNGDLLGMAGRSSRRPALDGTCPTVSVPASATPRRSVDASPRACPRIVVLVLSLAAMVLTSVSARLVTSARAQGDVAPPPGAKRAVIVAGPGPQPDRPLPQTMPRPWPDAAEAKGMEVPAIFHPNATKERVKRARQRRRPLHLRRATATAGPAPYGSFQESTKNGLGLDPDDPKERTTEQRPLQGRRLAPGERPPGAQRRGHPVPPVLCLGQRLVGHVHPQPGRGRPAHRQLTPTASWPPAPASSGRSAGSPAPTSSTPSSRQRRHDGRRLPDPLSRGRRTR